MNLHGQIMNLPVVPKNMDAEPNQRLAYKLGHRDARHAAAELALTADDQIRKLREALEWIARVNATDHEYQSKARSALKESV
jgi:galactose-1-phosphate uridylyltransferase